MIQRQIQIGLLLLGLATMVQASTVNILPNQNGVTDVVASIVSAASTGSTMAGMTVTVNFSSGAPQIVNWTSTGATSGQATGAITGGDWTLAVTGDTGSLTGGNPATA